MAGVNPLVYLSAVIVCLLGTLVSRVVELMPSAWAAVCVD